MKCVYLDCTEFGRSVLTPAVLDKVPDLVLHIGDPDPATLEALMDGAIGVVNGHTAMDDAFLSRHRALRTIVFLGTGASTYIDVNAAQRLDIRVRTVRGYGDRSVAEHAFALILAAARNIARIDRDLRRGAWEAPVGMELAGKRLGVVGTGGTGRALIRIASSFGMQVVAWNRSRPPEDLPCPLVPLEALLASSDVVSLHLALNDATRGLLGRSQLERMRPGAMLINVARGALVDEAALIDRLRGGHLAHAALDVFEQEWLPAGHPLTLLDNVTLTSHIAFKTREAMTRLLADGFDALRQDLASLVANLPLAD